MYNNNVKFCGEFLKKLGMRYFHGTSVDLKQFFLQNTGSEGNNYDLIGKIYIERYLQVFINQPNEGSFDGKFSGNTYENTDFML